MANLLNYDGQGTGTTNDTSTPFHPVSSFFLMAVGDLKTNITFTVQWLPEEEPVSSTDWQQANGTTVALTGTTKVAAVNYGKGFQYRIQRTGTGNQNEAVKFYWGHVTSVSYAFA